MAKMYVLVGVPGSGKSTWVKSQDWAAECAYISTDGFVDEYAASVNKTYSEVFDCIYAHCCFAHGRSSCSSSGTGKRYYLGSDLYNGQKPS